MIHRIDVFPAPAADGTVSDSLGDAVKQQIAEFGTAVGAVSTRRIFLIESDAAPELVRKAAGELLADPIVERAEVVDRPPEESGSRIEVHLKPGVMDPVASSTEMALRDMGVVVHQVRTGRAYLLDQKLDQAQLQRIASRVLANGVIESIHFKPFIPTELASGHDHGFTLRHVPIRELSEDQLKKLSREGHLFLSPGEMKAVQDYFRSQDREPTDIELETIAQTWSEHCVHKTLKSAVDVEVRDETGKVISTRRYANLIKDTIFASTQTLMKGERHGGTEARRHEGAEGSAEDAQSSSTPPSPPSVPSPPFCLSVFKDNAGVIAFDEVDAVCMTVETHNHPSAIEPYGGSATGIGGCIRDVMGTGLSAKPVANTNVFCVAYPDTPASDLPRGVIHPKRTLQQVVAGVRDYGNRMGIPTVNGAVYFDERYVGNPLVFCGCVGLIPRDKIEKAARGGDAIIVMGGRTGRDGIHGATFSSAELTDTHADEFSHAVQIGNAITQKQVMDVILQARDLNLFTGITDCGAGGLSSAIGEMGEKTGATVDLDKVPLKYAGLRYDEIWISEAQERMVLSVPQEHVAKLLKLAGDEDVEATVIGQFGTTDRQLLLHYRGEKVGQLSMKFMHDGLPMPTRKAIVVQSGRTSGRGGPPLSSLGRENHGRAAHATDTAPANVTAPSEISSRLLSLLAHPNIASKHWVIRQYDHEVQGGSVIKPLVGPQQIGPSDAAVVRPKLSSMKGVALGVGLCPQVQDPYDMAVAAIDEAVRNVVAVGADPDRVAILDNFCWPSVDDEITMGTLVRACEACRDVALAYGIPFISGKDSLHNQFTDSETGRVIKIPPTLLISAIGVMEDVRKSITMDLKRSDTGVYLISVRDPSDLQALSAMHRSVAKAIAGGPVLSCHDVSDGGILVAAAEMCIASGKGLVIDDATFTQYDAFEERPGQYLVELADSNAALAMGAALTVVADMIEVGKVQPEAHLMIGSAMSVSVADLTSAWRDTLDW